MAAVRWAVEARRSRRPGGVSLLFVFIGSIFLMMMITYTILSIGLGALSKDQLGRYHSPYSFDADRAHNPAWMADVPDHVNLTSLNIPGTHDTMTYDIDSVGLQCQNWNLSMQLQAGVRYVDVRARLRDDELYIYHSYKYTGHGYEEVLLTLFDFLDANPSEAIIMRVKEEGSPLGHNSISFEEAFNSYWEASATSAGASEHLYLYDPSEPIPAIGDLRSKIMVLQNFKTKNGTTYGLAWDGPQMALEDYWIIVDPDHLVDKWEQVQAALELASSSPLDNKLLYVAHISASVGVLPIEAAAGPLNHVIDGMNDLTGRWLGDFKGGDGNGDGVWRAGIVIFDFPGEKAINALLRWNKQLLQ